MEEWEELKNLMQYEDLRVKTGEQKTLNLK
jgi:hypothetical protein